MPVPDHFESINFSMCNFNSEPTIDNDLQEAIENKSTYGEHTAYNFYGYVYYKDGQFHEDVWQFKGYVETVSADTLEDLMELVNNKYGHD